MKYFVSGTLTDDDGNEYRFSDEIEWERIRSCDQIEAIEDYIRNYYAKNDDMVYTSCIVNNFKRFDLSIWDKIKNIFE